MNYAAGGGVRQQHSAPFFFEKDEPPWIDWNVVLDTTLENPVNTTAAVPFFLYLQPDALVKVDWGDGLVTYLDRSLYTNSSSLASVHCYERPGRWNVTMSSQKWSSVWMTVCSGMVIEGGKYNDKTACLKWWRKTLVESGRIPEMGGLLHFHQCSPSIVVSGLFNGSDQLDCVFEECTHLERVSEDVFYDWKYCISFRRAFWNCKSLKSVPSRIFAKAVSSADKHWCFYGCPAGESNAN